MGCVDSFLFTWISWIGLGASMVFMESLKMYRNGFSFLNNTWSVDAFKGWIFFPFEGFPRIYLVSYLMGMLFILLHVYFEFLFALLSLLGYVELVII
jgi:cell division protein FtsX